MDLISIHPFIPFSKKTVLISVKLSELTKSDSKKKKQFDLIW